MYSYYDMILFTSNEDLKTEFHSLLCFVTVLHPTLENAEKYLSLYRIQRFSDHLLAKWVVGGRSLGPAGHFVPVEFLPVEMRRYNNDNNCV
jgi:hypothetical protein